MKRSGLKRSKALIEYGKLHEVCEVCAMPGHDVHHIRSRYALGIRGEHESNFVKLCRKHHNEAHALGILDFGIRYRWLEKYARLREANGVGVYPLPETKACGDKEVPQVCGKVSKHGAASPDMQYV